MPPLVLHHYFTCKVFVKESPKWRSVMYYNFTCTEIGKYPGNIDNKKNLILSKVVKLVAGTWSRSSVASWSWLHTCIWARPRASLLSLKGKEQYSENSHLIPSSGCGSWIQCFFSPWIRHPDPRSGSGIRDPGYTGTFQIMFPST